MFSELALELVVSMNNTEGSGTARLVIHMSNRPKLRLLRGEWWSYNEFDMLDVLSSKSRPSPALWELLGSPGAMRGRLFF